MTVAVGVVFGVVNASFVDVDNILRGVLQDVLCKRGMGSFITLAVPISLFFS